MNNGIKAFLCSMVEFAIFFMIFYLVTTGIHEWFHLTTLKMLGGEGYIIKDVWGVTGTVFIKEPSNPFLVCLAGGIGTGLLYLAIIILNWYDKIHRDFEEVAALVPFCICQLVYGIFEGFFIGRISIPEFYTISGIIGPTTMTIGLIIGMIIMVKGLMDKGV